MGANVNVTWKQLLENPQREQVTMKQTDTEWVKCQEGTREEVGCKVTL